MTDRPDNQVFQGGNPNPSRPTHVDPSIQAHSAADAVKSEFGLEIPVESVPLPSGGKVYPKDHPLHMKETVDITSMTAREEDILTSQALIKKGTVITELIRSCLVDKSIDPASLIAGDRNALMVAVRITGYGAEYDGEVTCGQGDCGKATKRDFDLAQLPISRLEIEPVALGQNLFEFDLPRSKMKVQFKYLTGHDEEEIQITEERKKKMMGFQANTSLVTTNLLHSIISIGGDSDRVKIARFVSMMPALDSSKLRKFMKDSEPGIKMKLWSACGACGEEEEVSLPLGVKFLWPNAE